MSRYDLTELAWRFIETVLPTKTRGVKRRDDRQVLNGIFYVLRTGCPWRDLPARSPRACWEMCSPARWYWPTRLTTRITSVI